MSGKLTLIIGGLIVGILLMFAFIGAKSIFGNNNPPKPADTSGWQAPAVTYSPGNIPTIGANDNKMASSHLDVAPPTEENLKPELVNEPPAPDSGINADIEKPAATKPPVDEPQATAVTLQDEAKDEVKPVETPPPPPAQPTVTATTGRLEIMTQMADNGQVLKASVYVQRPDGTQIDKSSNASKSVFTLKPGTYKITARAEGYASMARTITVPANAVVNQIFPLPNLVATTPEPATPPTMPVQAQANPEPNTMPMQPRHPHRHMQQPPAMGNGKLRVVALSADDGSPLQVDFTIRRADGTVIERLDNVAMSELNLPAQEVIASFNFRGLQGQQTLLVQPGQTTTHTFNIRGVGHPAAMPPQQQQPMSPEDMIRQRIQEEILNRMR